MASQQTDNGPSENPRRVIGGFASFALVAGSMLGIGIFLVPSQIAAQVDSSWSFLLVWGLGGLFALAGVVACGELGAMLPKAGGDYVFQREAFGESIAFGSGWVLFGAIFTGSVAALAVGLCQYQLPVLLGIDMSQPVFGAIKGHQVAGVLLIVVLTALNSLGTRLSAGTQTLLTMVPLGTLAVLALVVLLSGSSGSLPAVAGEALAQVGSEGPTLSLEAIVLAYVAVYFAYSGWNSVIYVAGEVRRPGKNIPRALISGTLVVTVLYVLMCLAFLQVLGLDGLRMVGEAGTASANALAGSEGTIIITTLIAMALMAGLNGTILGGARVAYAMGRGGAFWSGAALLDRRSRVPVRALWLQAAWASVLVLSGSFEQIINLAGLAMIITGSLTIASLYVLRRKMPQAERPYRATGYPWLPALYLVSNAIVIVVMVGRAFDDKDNSWFPLLGLGIMVVAFTCHFLWVRRRQHVVAMLLIAVVGGGLLVVRGATAGTPAVETPDKPAEVEQPPSRETPSDPEPGPDYDALRKAALDAADSPESIALRRLDSVLTCRSDKPALEIRDYARYCKVFREYHQTYADKTLSLAAPWIAERRPKDIPRTVFYPFPEPTWSPASWPFRTRCSTST